MNALVLSCGIGLALVLFFDFVLYWRGLGSNGYIMGPDGSLRKRRRSDGALWQWMSSFLVVVLVVGSCSEGFGKVGVEKGFFELIPSTSTITPTSVNLFYEINGTIYCPNAKIGSTGYVGNILYTCVSSTSLEQIVGNIQNNNFQLLESVCTSRVTSMAGLFFLESKFNANISTWDVSSVTDMSGLFSGASVFNGDLSRWNVSKVTDMLGMFTSAFQFNQDLSNWNVSRVKDFQSMFDKATSMKGNLSNWCANPDAYDDFCVQGCNITALPNFQCGLTTTLAPQIPIITANPTAPRCFSNVNRLFGITDSTETPLYATLDNWGSNDRINSTGQSGFLYLPDNFILSVPINDIFYAGQFLKWGTNFLIGDMGIVYSTESSTVNTTDSALITNSSGALGVNYTSPARISIVHKPCLSPLTLYNTCPPGATTHCR